MTWNIMQLCSQDPGRWNRGKIRVIRILLVVAAPFLLTQSEHSILSEEPMAHKYYPNPLEKIVFSPDGPQPQELFAEGQVRIIMVGLQVGQKIPVHPGGLASFQFLEGRGVMIVDGERLPVEPGTVIITQHGAPRGIEAVTELKFMAVRITDFPH
jgi:quercetin dioxygenase-like cupin family protein